MKPTIKLLAALWLSCAAPALAQGVSRVRPIEEHLALTIKIGGVLTTSTLGGYVLPTRSFEVQAVTGRCGAPSAGAGTVTFRVSDGTNNCDCAAGCTTTGVTGMGDAGMKRIACTGSCTFAASSALTFSVTSPCASTQPTVTNLDVRGVWR
jgi:hypothetical protein